MYIHNLYDAVKMNEQQIVETVKTTTKWLGKKCNPLQHIKFVYFLQTKLTAGNNVSRMTKLGGTRGNMRMLRTF